MLSFHYNTDASHCLKENIGQCRLQEEPKSTESLAGPAFRKEERTFDLIKYMPVYSGFP